MRIAAGLVASGLAALATASAVSSAAIYELNTPAPSGSSLEVTAEQAKLGLALALGVSRYHRLNVQGSDDTKIEVLERFGRLEDRMGVSPDNSGRFMLSIAGISMEHADGLPLNEPLMIVKNSPSIEATAELLRQLAEEKAETLSKSLQEIASLDSSFCVATPIINDAESIISNYKFANYKSWLVGEENKGVTSEMIAVFNPDRNEDRLFMSEYLIFKAFVEKIVPRMHDDKSFAFCHFEGIRHLITTYGQESTEANLALSLYHAALLRLSTPSNTKVTLLLTPGNSHGSPGFEIASHLSRKRAELPLSLSTPAKIQAKPSSKSTPLPNLSGFSASAATFNRFQRCYSNQDACSNSTSSCSSHGQCLQLTKGCWSCACKPTVKKATDGGHQQVTYWAGYGCQKQDVSMPFNLFLIFSIALVLVVAWAIGQLYAIGEEELPGVLSAGVTPVKRA